MSTFLALSAVAFTAWIIWDNCDLCSRSEPVGFDSIRAARDPDEHEGHPMRRGAVQRQSSMRFSFREDPTEFTSPSLPPTCEALHGRSSAGGEHDASALPSSSMSRRHLVEAGGRKSGAGMTLGSNF